MFTFHPFFNAIYIYRTNTYSTNIKLTLTLHLLLTLRVLTLLILATLTMLFFILTLLLLAPLKPWPNGVASRRKLKTWVYLRLRLARPCFHLR